MSNDFPQSNYSNLVIKGENLQMKMIIRNSILHKYNKINRRTFISVVLAKFRIRKNETVFLFFVLVTNKSKKITLSRVTSTITYTNIFK